MRYVSLVHKQLEYKKNALFYSLSIKTINNKNKTKNCVDNQKYNTQ